MTGNCGTERLKNRIAELSIEMLCAAFEGTNKSDQDFRAVVLIRELVMDELERRDPVAMAAWDDTEDPALMDKPSAFFTSP